MEKNSETQALGIVALTLAVIALLGSWIPLLNYIAFLFGVLALILGLIDFWIHRKGKKALGILASALAALSIGIFAVTQASYARSLEEIFYESEYDYEADYDYDLEEEVLPEVEFPWTQKDFDNLVLGNEMTGAGGANLKDVLAKFGEPSSTIKGSVEIQSQKFETQKLWYIDENIDSDSSVMLLFVKQDNGDWLLISKAAEELDTNQEKSDEETVT
ncbi:hypothetical protein HZZ02_00530 [Streptococcus danieliae]|nr:hypothetical protein [Streptococcus danieliae]